jgi:hypothetical protein
MLAFKNLVFFVLSIALLTCGSFSYAHKVESQTESAPVKNKKKVLIEPIVIRVTGYGAYEKKEDAKSESKRLMAIRASKLDAYRALAERIYGIGISGASEVDEFVLKNDGYAAVVDSYVRGARVISIIENKDRGFETVLELLLPGDFNDCINKVNSLRFDRSCLRPLPMRVGQEAVSNNTSSQSMQSIYHLK